jgi:hypothetical protein
MQENQFFRFVWRVNGIAIMMLVVSAVVVGGHEIITSLIGHANSPVITNVADDPGNKERWHLGSVNEIPETPFLFMRLESENKNIEPGKSLVASQRMESYHSGASRNVLFVNLDTMDMKWLFGRNSQLLKSIDLLTERRYYEKSKPRAILYLVVKKDTNNNKILDEGDSPDIAISDVSGENYIEFVSTVDQLIGTRLSGANKITVFYQVHGVGYAVSMDIATHTVSKPIEMPKVPKSP